MDRSASDTDGNLYPPRPAQEPGVYVYSPTGEELAFIPTPQAPTNAAFGRGALCRTLFVTAGTILYKIDLRKEGYHATQW